MVLLDREPLSLHCALLSAAASGVKVDMSTAGAATGDVMGPEGLGLTEILQQMSVAAPASSGR